MHGIELIHRNVLAVKRDGVAVAAASLEHAIVYGKQVARIARLVEPLVFDELG